MARNNLVTKQYCPPNLVPAVTVLKEPQWTPMAEASRRHAERWQQQVMGCASNNNAAWFASGELARDAQHMFTGELARDAHKHVPSAFFLQPHVETGACTHSCARFVLAPVVPLDWHWRQLARYVGVHLRG